MGHLIWGTLYGTPYMGHLIWGTLYGAPVGHLIWGTWYGAPDMGHLIWSTLYGAPVGHLMWSTYVCVCVCVCRIFYLKIVICFNMTSEGMNKTLCWYNFDFILDNTNHAWHIHFIFEESTFLRYTLLPCGREIIKNVSRNAYGAISFSSLVLSFIVIICTVSILSVRWL